MTNGYHEYDGQDDPINIYLREIGTVPPISADEERGLRDRIAADKTDQDAKKRLVESHLMAVVEAARQYESPEIQLLDLIQQGNMGLMEAVNRAAVCGDDRFGLFAEGYIHRALREFVATPRTKTIPPHLREI